jgi:hypothetical protein
MFGEIDSERHLEAVCFLKDQPKAKECCDFLLRVASTDEWFALLAMCQDRLQSAGKSGASARKLASKKVIRFLEKVDGLDESLNQEDCDVCRTALWSFFSEASQVEDLTKVVGDVTIILDMVSGTVSRLQLASLKKLSQQLQAFCSMDSTETAEELANKKVALESELQRATRSMSCLVLIDRIYADGKSELRALADMEKVLPLLRQTKSIREETQLCFDSYVALLSTLLEPSVRNREVASLQLCSKTLFKVKLTVQKVSEPSKAMLDSDVQKFEQACGQKEAAGAQGRTVVTELKKKTAGFVDKFFTEVMKDSDVQEHYEGIKDSFHLYQQLSSLTVADQKFDPLLCQAIATACKQKPVLEKITQLCAGIKGDEPFKLSHLEDALKAGDFLALKWALSYFAEVEGKGGSVCRVCVKHRSVPHRRYRGFYQHLCYK